MMKPGGPATAATRPSYKEREAEAMQQFAMSVWLDPSASSEDREAAKKRLMDAGGGGDDESRRWDALTDEELEHLVYLCDRAAGEAEPDLVRRRQMLTANAYSAWLEARHHAVAPTDDYLGRLFRTCFACGAACSACRQPNDPPARVLTEDKPLHELTAEERTEIDPPIANVIVFPAPATAAADDVPSWPTDPEERKHAQREWMAKKLRDDQEPRGSCSGGDE
jgi:hypothetical protein